MSLSLYSLHFLEHCLPSKSSCLSPNVFMALNILTNPLSQLYKTNEPPWPILETCMYHRVLFHIQPDTTFHKFHKAPHNLFLLLDQRNPNTSSLSAQVQLHCPHLTYLILQSICAIKCIEKIEVFFEPPRIPALSCVNTRGLIDIQYYRYIEPGCDSVR